MKYFVTTDRKKKADNKHSHQDFYVNTNLMSSNSSGKTWQHL